MLHRLCETVVKLPLASEIHLVLMLFLTEREGRLGELQLCLILLEGVLQRLPGVAERAGGEDEADSASRCDHERSYCGSKTGNNGCLRSIAIVQSAKLDPVEEPWRLPQQVQETSE
ncbi:hypothetical protein BV882_07780 [Streptomyces sp. 46]|nr:hypothetical protein BV882_07780 [Streptomyces sp. 46]